MKVTVNGMERTFEADPLASLLHVLREEFDLTGAKAGCQAGSCGTCTVLIDGEPRRSCLAPMATLEGAHITTVEGLGDPQHLSAVQQAFDEHYGAQCGFCTSGMVVAGTALIDRKGGPVEREDVVEALGGHFCRCTGYIKIVDSVVVASRGEIGSRAPSGLEIKRTAS